MDVVNRLVAERVMGWTVSREQGIRWAVPLSSAAYFRDWDGKEVSGGAPPFATNLSDAWEVVDEMRQKGDYILLFAAENDYYVVGYISMGVHTPQVASKSKCLAICLAALRAIGMTEAEIDVPIASRGVVSHEDG